MTSLAIGTTGRGRGCVDFGVSRFLVLVAMARRRPLMFDGWMKRRTFGSGIVNSPSQSGLIDASMKR